ncbi:Ferric/Cupric Reductase Transmembrane Component [Pleurotus pulmonarius]
MANTGKPPEIPAEFQIYNSYVEDPKWQRKFSIVWASFLGAAILLALPSLLRLVRRRGFSTVFGSWLGGVREDRRRGRYKPVDDHPDGERSKSEPREHQTTRPKSSAVLNRVRSMMLLTPPGIELNVAQLTLIVGYIILVVVCIVTDAQLIENSNRAGFIAIAQLPPVFLFASKNSVLSLLFGSGYGYEKLNFLHKWSSRSLFLAAVLHGALWIRNHLEWNLPILGEQKETTGVAALGVLCVLVLSSLRPLRRRWYQFFFVIHVLGFVAFFVTLCYHTIYASPWIFPPLAFYGFDILLRLFRYRIKDAELIPVGNQMTIINIRDCTDGWLPGQHVRLRIFFSGRIFESHPLTIMNNPSAGGVAEKKHASGVEEEDGDKMEGMVLGARVCGDWTRAVNEYALKEGERVRRISAANEKDASTSSTPLPASTSTPVPIQVMIDGPYGGCSIDLGDYENVLLVAGGSGATFSIGMLDDIVKRCAGARAGGEKTRRIEFVWCVKSFGSINWFAALLAPIAELAATSPGLDLHITIFVTCLCDPESVPEIPNMDVILERPDVYKLLEALISPHDEVEEGDVDADVDVEADAEARAPTPPHHHLGTTSKKHALRWAGFGGGVGICASGPESLTREAANAVARLGLRKGKQVGGVGLHTELFAM